MIEINERISVLQSSEQPVLSADVYVIKGDRFSYIVDVGSNDEALTLVKSIPNKKIVITHFHEDHTDNLKRLDIPDEDIFVGGYTRKYTGKGTEVKEKIVIEDGVKIVIAPLPNSHAKGSLCVTVGDEYLIIGDAFYSSSKGYSVSLLGEEIKTLKSLEFKEVLMSHKQRMHPREIVIGSLEKFFAQREKGIPYIPFG